MSHQGNYSCSRRRRSCQRNSTRLPQNIEEPIFTHLLSPFEYAAPPPPRRGLSANPPQKQNEPEVDDGIRVIIRPLVKSANQRRSEGAASSSEASPNSAQPNTN
ncbi:hypothetical protein TcWFU_000638 [Taenia crassiceps]|uniref:Uncharacterized protein n=1 Tax=Taenia crassiceps TaxID=6207 RepID=A0ABR4QF74_9CEST